MDYWMLIRELEKRDKYLDLASALKKTVETESDSAANCKSPFLEWSLKVWKEGWNHWE